MIQWNELSKAYLTPGGHRLMPVVNGVTLSIECNEFVSLVGPSGCGKSTLLNIAAGLDTPSRGTISYKGKPLVGINSDVGYMTQKDSLLPWKTTAENVAIPLKIRGAGIGEIRDTTAHYLSLMGLTEFSHHYPSQLSGGMRKRAAIARTLIYQPDCLLMDEPFGALDVQIRLMLQRELARILEAEAGSSGKTVVFVTHDLREAIALSDRVVVLSARPAQIRYERRIPFSRPRDPLTVQFEPEFEAIHRELWEALEGEVAKGTEA
ncbi:ABC transporter ATP-binding protein [Paraburkholderia sp.]|uniref:ABC transporter ATP-binding protein n=1 Tax=Paraburkholderia sp. TaxID=1926495 RepID=UPI0039E301D8